MNFGEILALNSKSTEYQAIKDEIMTFGRPTRRHGNKEDFACYSNMNFTNEKAMQLLKMLVSESLTVNLFGELKNIDYSYMIHGYRILEYYQYKEAIHVLIYILDLGARELFFLEQTEDLITAIASFESLSIQPVLKYLKIKDELIRKDSLSEMSLLTVLFCIAKTSKEEIKGEIESVFFEKLSEYETESPSVNSMLAYYSLFLNKNLFNPLISKIIFYNFLDEDSESKYHIKARTNKLNLKNSRLVPYCLTDNFYSGDKRFKAILRTVSASGTLEEMKFFLLGLHSGFNSVSKEKAIELFFKKTSISIDTFETEGQKTYFYREFFGLYHVLSNFKNKILPLPLEKNVDAEKFTNSLLFNTKRALESFQDGLVKSGNKAELYLKHIGDFSFANKVAKLLEELEELDFDKLQNSLSKEETESLNKLILNEWNSNYLTFQRSIERVKTNLY